MESGRQVAGIRQPTAGFHALFQL